MTTNQYYVNPQQTNDNPELIDSLNNPTDNSPLKVNKSYDIITNNNEYMTGTFFIESNELHNNFKQKVLTLKNCKNLNNNSSSESNELVTIPIDDIRSIKLSTKQPGNDSLLGIFGEGGRRRRRRAKKSHRKSKKCNKKRTRRHRRR